MADGPAQNRRSTPGLTGMKRTIVLATACACILMAAAAARAHDFWIEPSSFHPPSGAVVAVHLWVGQNFVGDPVPHQSNDIEAFFIRQGQSGTNETIDGADGRDPAGQFLADARVTAVIGYRSGGSYIELPADKFEDYLRLYGLDSTIAERARRGETKKPGRERFYRYAKALLTGAGVSAAATQPLGFAYEIVPDDDPTRAAAPVRGHVRYDGKPLAGALVEALWHQDPRLRLSARSDAQGAFSFTLPRAGIWLIKSVHMVRAGFFAGEDWDSLWASLTFEAPEKKP